MTEPTQDKDKALGTPPATDTVQLSKEDHAALVSRAAAQSGTDTANTQLQKDLKAANERAEGLAKSLTEKMTDQEKKDSEYKGLIDKVDSLTTKLGESESSREKEKLEILKTKLMAAEKIDIGYSENIHGSTEEELTGSIQRFKERRAEENKELLKGTYKSDPPANGSTSNGDKQMSRADFDNLSPKAKSETAKAGVKITE